jgi:hypothetical protein
VPISCAKEYFITDLASVYFKLDIPEYFMYFLSSHSRYQNNLHMPISCAKEYFITDLPCLHFKLEISISKLIVDSKMEKDDYLPIARLGKCWIYLACISSHNDGKLTDI